MDQEEKLNFSSIAYYYLGVANDLKGEYEKSESYYNKVTEICAIWERCKKMRGREAPAIFGLAKLKIRFGKREEAFELFKKSYEMFMDKDCCSDEICKSKRVNYCLYGAGLSLHEIGEIYFDSNEYEKALTSFKESLELIKEVVNITGEKELLIWALLDMSKVLIEMSRYKEASKYLIEAKAALEDAKKKFPGRDLLSKIEKQISELEKKIPEQGQQ